MSLIGYTTGVFDLFHIGHLNILRRAKQECDHLIVGVTTDELSLSQKNKKPVIQFSERIDIVQSIRYVDEVVPQVDMDKVEAWRRLNFDVMMVGSDWKGTKKWNDLEESFRSFDVRILYFDYTQTTSSTELRKVIEKISEGHDGR
jgi:glycerol-3-phosphate cytidylyltransferase